MADVSDGDVVKHGHADEFVGLEQPRSVIATSARDGALSLRRGEGLAGG